jgi:centrosomal protein CEP135
MEFKEKTPENVEQIMKERDFYQKAYRKISLENNGTDEHVTTEHVTELIRERDQMSSRIIQLENRLADMNSNLKVVQQERDRVQLQNEEINGDLTTIRREIINSNSPVKHQKPTQSTPQSILKRIETERDSALTDLRRITCERDSLLEQEQV